MAKLLSLFKSAWFVTLVGIALLSVLVWLGGPYLGIGDAQPLASPVARLLLIMLFVLAWGAWLQVQQLRARGKASKMSGELAGQGAAAPAGNDDNRSAAERSQLQGRFAEAVETLRKRRRGNLYALPWYVVIGPPGSGKSTLLQNSGLNFPLSERFGKEALRGVGGTRNCDWWFTDEAVFLDTAGRYTTQDSDRAADSTAWGEFLKLLRRYRKRRPINGVIVAMSLSDLMVLDEAGRQEHARAIRRRLDELSEHLKIGVPVYLVLTKCDLVAGFGEFFDDLNPELRSQVWGVSFPVGKTMDGSAAKAFADEYRLLLDRLNTRTLDRLHAERDRGRRAAVLSFPQQLAALGETARQFVEGVFASHAYGTPPLLRGVYLTSGTQEGTPIDRMMGAVARTFGLDVARVHAPGAQRRTFFVERLLKDVLFRESGLAGTNPAIERRKVAMQLAAYAGMALLTVLLCFGFATSYARNRAYLGQVQGALKGYPAGIDLEASATPKEYFAKVLDRLEALSAVKQTATPEGGAPLSMRLGLYQGRAVGEDLHAAYLRELNALLLPGVGAQFRGGLAASASDPQALYYYLKGYLMLGQPRHLDADELVALTNLEWRKVFPDEPVLQQALARHFQALVDDPAQLRALTLDGALVEQARTTLRTADLSTLVYGSMKLSAENAGKPLQLDKELGLLGNVFRRKSGKPLSEPLPAVFTQPVFAIEADKGIDEAVRQFAQDDWVFGAEPIDAIAQARLSRQVLALYETDYIKAWDDLLADLQLQPIGSIQDASTIAAKLSGPSSPLKSLLQVVGANTSDMLRAPTPDAGDKALAAAKNAAAKKATQNALGRALAKAGGGAGAEEAPPGSAISAHFDTLNKLSEGAPGAAPIDQTLTVLDQLSKTLLTMTDFSDAAGQPNPQLLMAQQAAAQLPPPVSGWVASLTGKSQALVASGTKGALGEQFQQAAAQDCAAFTQGRFPFSPTSRNDIPVQNFAELFGYGGRYDGFFRQTLAKLVDTSGRTWRWKSGPGAVSGSASMLAQMQLADSIKQMYFRNGSAVPEVGFTLVAPVLAPGIGRFSIAVDGQTFDYKPGNNTSMAMKWPGPTPGQVKVAAWDTAGNLLSSYDYQGDWAFFHALQAAHLARQSDLRYQAHFDFGGQAVQLVVQASNLKNPFLNTQVQRFRCGG
ncbi:type VI secretion system membrane subunit TssM [Frateuria sp. STR12]|uniref:type VI secretion system membrane subunit TssM n=1 Tax=Frateuria hangzhouensis TaxID=2995589 RepID=UPI002260DF63|nr:type VI secretion system membrane subunit TssM [Frateuria sp. STR12]MCX7514341.1 type VI secretion system membrane subunit TssM [Frateuria sp. STR12]